MLFIITPQISINREWISEFKYIYGVENYVTGKKNKHLIEALVEALDEPLVEAFNASTCFNLPWFYAKKKCKLPRNIPV